MARQTPQIAIVDFWESFESLLISKRVVLPSASPSKNTIIDRSRRTKIAEHVVSSMGLRRLYPQVYVIGWEKEMIIWLFTFIFCNSYKFMKRLETSGRFSTQVKTFGPIVSDSGIEKRRKSLYTLIISYRKN